MKTISVLSGVLCLLCSSVALAQTAPKPTGTTEPTDTAPVKDSTTVTPPAPPSKAALAEAKVRHERGLALYEDGDYKLALIEFQRAYEMAPSYKLLFLLGQVQLQLNSYAAARITLEKYLAQGGKEIPAAKRKLVEKDLRALQVRTAHVTVNSVEGAEVVIDDVSVGKAPVVAFLVDAGNHKITVSKDGFVTGTKSITLAGADDEKVQIDLEEVKVVVLKDPDDLKRQLAELGKKVEDSRRPIEPPKPPASYLWVGWVATGAFAAGAVVTGVVALNGKSELNSTLLNGPTTGDQVNSIKTRTQTFGLVTDILGAAAIVTAGVTVFFTLKQPSTKKTASTSFVVGPGSAGVRGTF